MVVLLLVLPVRVVLLGGSRSGFFLLFLMLYRCNLFFFFISLPILSVVIFRVDVAVAAVGDPWLLMMVELLQLRAPPMSVQQELEPHAASPAGKPSRCRTPGPVRETSTSSVFIAKRP